MFVLMNQSDGIPASPDLFRTRREARRYASAFRARYRQQGYYLTAEGLRIAPEEIELEIVPAEP